MEKLNELQNRLGYHFKDLELLRCALTHRSVSSNNNERLEFLGDAVLSMIVAQELFQRYPEALEGQLSRLRSTLVNGDTLANLALKMDLPPCLQLGQGEVKSGGQFRHSILADAFEAIIGALYLDAGLETTRSCVVNWYDTCYTDLSQVELVKDAKSLLQEWTQAEKLSLPQYTAKVTGEAHDQTFYVTCRVQGLEYVGHGESTSRRRAEQLAAQHFLDQMHE